MLIVIALVAPVVIVVLITVIVADSGWAEVGEVGCSLGSRHARLDAGLVDDLSLSVAVEPVFDLLHVPAVAWVDQVLTNLGAEE